MRSFVFIGLFIFLVGCIGLKDTPQDDRVEWQFAKIYTLHKLEKIFGVRLDFSKDVEVSINVDALEFASIMGDGLSKKIGDGFSVRFMNRKVNTFFEVLKIKNERDDRLLYRVYLSRKLLS